MDNGMTNVEDGEKIRKWEPLFGNAEFYFPLRHPALVSSIYDDLDKDGGFIMDYVCGKISFGQYSMKCELRGEDDYHLQTLRQISTFWTDWAVQFENRCKKYGMLSASPSEREMFKMFKHRLLRFREEVARLNLKEKDNL